MGDAADYILDSIYDDYGRKDDGPPTRNEKPKTCRCCGQKNLYWIVITGKENGMLFTKWVLGDNRGMHQCKKNKLKIKRI